MSMTVTQIITAAPAAPALPVLRLHVNPEQRIRDLLAKMREAASALPHEHQEEVLKSIHDWEVQFFGSYKLDIKAAHALLFLRVSHIEFSVVGYAVGIQEKIKWVKFSNEIKEIVTLILPPETDVEAFIEADMRKQLEVRLRYKTAQVINEIMAAFARLEDGLYASVDPANQGLQREFEEIKKILGNLNSERKAAIGQLHGELERLTEKVTKIYEDLEQQLNTTRDLGQRIKIKEEVLSNLLNECEAVVNI